MLARWAGEVLPTFGFVLKASRYITHRLRLKDSAEPVARIFGLAAELGDKRGAFLFQLPPFVKKDAARLREFLAIVPEGMRVALEFRHASWFGDDIYEA